MSRRQVVAGLAAVALSSPARTETTEPLGRKGAAAGLRVGSAVRAAGLDDPRLCDLLVSQVMTLTPELEFKWAALAPAPDRRDVEGADRVAAFARAHGKRLRGHTLLWHRSIPEWGRRELASSAGWDIVARHIDETIGRYGALVDEWDVINEPIEIGRRPDNLRGGVFLDAFGSNYIARALRTAHAAAPAARLLINEYDLEYALPEDRARRATLLRLAGNLVEHGAPLHGIGIQAHLNLGKGPIAETELREFVEAIGALGLTVTITELDCKERDYVLPAAERDRLVATHVASFLAAVVPCRAVTGVSSWGLSDDRSWLEVTTADRARFPGAWTDGSSPGFNRGLPYDANKRPKPMRDAMIGAFEARRT